MSSWNTITCTDVLKVKIKWLSENGILNFFALLYMLGRLCEEARYFCSLRFNIHGCIRAELLVFSLSIGIDKNFRFSSKSLENGTYSLLNNASYSSEQLCLASCFTYKLHTSYLQGSRQCAEQTMKHGCHLYSVQLCSALFIYPY